MDVLSSCTLCPRRCGANRRQGEAGFCGARGTMVRLARAALHFWEEPCLSEPSGSGTVFFSGCPLRCVFCQNRAISRELAGRDVSIERLAAIFLELQEKGAQNINLVSPTPYVPQIIEALKIAKAAGLTLPVVYNTGGYERPQTIEALAGMIDIYLPDFKFMDPSLAERYARANDYADWAKRSLAAMVRQVGPVRFDGEGRIKKGVIVRHLVLPDRTVEAMRILDYLWETYGSQIYISLMNQYTPMPDVPFAELTGPVPPEQYERLVRYAQRIGVENAYIQEGGTVSQSFIPPFDSEGL